MTKLETKVVLNKPGVVAQAAVIVLHGLGADYNDFVPLVEQLNLSISVKFIFPNAPLMPVTVNNGMLMRAWYDISAFSSLLQDVDRAGILHSVAVVEGLIDGLLQDGLSPKKIIIAGFSQGGVISYYTGLNSKYSLGGLLVLSGYLPDTSLLQISASQLNLPIMICHGKDDQIVPITYAKQGLPYLQQCGLNYVWKEYSMEHSVCAQQVKDIAQWLQLQLI
jgi:phospholipase/carboxylesterase